MLVENGSIGYFAELPTLSLLEQWQISVAEVADTGCFECCPMSMRPAPEVEDRYELIAQERAGARARLEQGMSL